MAERLVHPALAWCALLLGALVPWGVAAQQPAPSELPPLSQPVLEVAAFRVAPVAIGTADVRAKTVSPAGRLTDAAGQKERVVELRAKKGERWQELLSRAAESLSMPLTASASQASFEALPALLAGKYLRARVVGDAVIEIDYVLSATEAYALHFSANEVLARTLTGDPRLIERMRADLAKASLFTAADAIGLPESIALQLTEIFAGEVDFLRELHLGYRCAIVYEAHYREGFIEPSGRILAAELDIGKRRYRAYFSPDTKGQTMYFDESGKSTRRMFRRSPLEFTRVTSDYTLARFHPILGVWTAHRGVDSAAPTGTKIMSVADGVVEYVGPRGGYGNLVILRHQDKFLTYYAHMNAFAPNLAVGNKVAQGEIIGFVGMTGLATGPHLHFEFHVRNGAGVWESVPAPDVIESTSVAAPGFTERVRAYRNSLVAAEQDNLLILD